MTDTTYLIRVYLIYGAVSVSLVVYLARTLFRNGEVFLEDVFADRPELAAAVNKLLVIGFYLLNLGYAFLLLRSNDAPTALDATEILIRKLGILLISLGILHFANMYLFYRIRQRGQEPTMPPPVPPQVAVDPEEQGWRPVL